MWRSAVLAAALVWAAAYGAGLAEGPRRSHPPRIGELEPASGRPGDVITARGHSLDRAHVEDLALAAGERHLLVHIIDQDETSICFRIPASATPGRWTIVIHPVGKYAQGIEQPVALTVSRDFRFGFPGPQQYTPDASLPCRS
ncbi:MAG: hypothetical protein FJW37_12845 [Acidobacteria bacterium]|nr:hypothetical protein [Acidobacteriota bacterium]